ncbi:EAL and HDOD domain-containing protein [Sulfuritalea hydrogenivorans]|jgi:EAL and modified HD-GYP domain-containing signal transduction protein|uniref:Diguanylate phosphodiesterase n=1 Tax=Sulfuritalea hydrogenivorans sk43H TaxID=1223802 RepID=W0SKB0_9PROT|nr:HDOD domain-containing protein [Sulfuritalea hydrogenivorans]MDK9715628.1 EAL domain-containing protein [Sulfuritalea sp.]BAO31312.1 diguanylate phosphodiesterase [Sulfuritalea hydrogenivorans sk43H]
MSDQAPQIRDQLREVFIGRQPILDKDQGLAGYELLFRASAENSAHVDSATAAKAATADVVCKAFAELGLANVFGQVRAFINVDALFLESDLVELLPKDIVVLEIDVVAFDNPALLPRCQELKAKGYAFSLSGVTDVGDHLWPLVDLATWLKINIDGLAGDQLQTSARALGTTRRLLVAAHVESQSQMELCRLLGFQLFQGYYFAKPVIVEGRKLDASTQGLLRLIKLVADDADPARLDAAFRTEPALVINLLRLTNSVGVGARARITSVRHAITVLGRRQLQRWLQLLLFSRGADIDLAHNPLLQLAALRGRFMELLVEKLHPGQRDLRDPAFITGLMSVVPAALGMSMTDVLAQIAVGNDVRLALTHREGTLGKLFALTERYDDNDVAGVQELLSPYGANASLGLLGEILGESLTWVQQLGMDAE